MHLRKSPVAWHECEFVSLSNAARIAGRAEGWTREAITSGRLKAVRLPTGGPPVVTVSSLRRLLSEVEPVASENAPAPRRPALRLVATNH